jgi:transposase
MKPLLKICCGLDIHKEIIEACILKGTENDEVEIVRNSFSTMRGKLYHLRNCLISNDCKDIAMERTGIYWKSLYDILEEIGDMNIFVVNAHHMRNIPGRKTDIKDAQWIAELFRHGLLEASFIPEKNIRELREFIRYHKKITEDRAKQSNRIEKFLQPTDLNCLQF